MTRRTAMASKSFEFSGNGGNTKFVGQYYAH